VQLLLQLLEPENWLQDITPNVKDFFDHNQQFYV